jgi:hypothetical protein
VHHPVIAKVPAFGDETHTLISQQLDFAIEDEQSTLN